MGVRSWIVFALAIAAVTWTAGCGGGGTKPAGTTIPAYGGFPAQTIPGSAAAEGGSPACRADARSFAKDAADLLAHFGPRAAYPADLSYVIIRNVFADFRAHGCDLRLLGRALRRRLTAKQGADLVDDLPGTMAAVVRRALAGPS